tara:strand:+ start:481 stop:972 length:492 start_codon:yes stop_codon:yes gene_type:complete
MAGEKTYKQSKNAAGKKVWEVYQGNKLVGTRDTKPGDTRQNTSMANTIKAATNAKNIKENYTYSPVTTQREGEKMGVYSNKKLIGYKDLPTGKQETQKFKDTASDEASTLAFKKQQNIKVQQEANKPDYQTSHADKLARDKQGKIDEEKELTEIGIDAKFRNP